MKVFTAEKDLLFSPWTTGIDQIFEKHRFNDFQEYSLAEIVYASPKLLKKIKAVRKSLRKVKFLHDQDLYGLKDGNIN